MHVSLLVQRRQVPLLVVAQVTKRGEPAGEQGLSHVVDVVIEVEAGTARLIKNRFGPLSEFPVFEEVTCD